MGFLSRSYFSGWGRKALSQSVFSHLVCTRTTTREIATGKSIRERDLFKTQNTSSALWSREIDVVS